MEVLPSALLSEDINEGYETVSAFVVVINRSYSGCLLNLPFLFVLDWSAWWQRSVFPNMTQPRMFMTLLRWFERLEQRFDHNKNTQYFSNSGYWMHFDWQRFNVSLCHLSCFHFSLIWLRFFKPNLFLSESNKTVKLGFDLWFSQLTQSLLQCYTI